MRFETWLKKHWYSPRKTWLAYVLYPVSLLFFFLVGLRRYLYRHAYLSTYRAPCPVIVVGNISVGGVGKTPFVIELYFFLQALGFVPGIVSRGYQGAYEGVMWVTPTSTPEEVGDEAVLLALRTQAPMVVSRHRASAIELLLKKTKCNIIISDDGLQHYAMARDIEIVIVDLARQQGNGLGLPAGPLREPLSRLKSVDLLVTHGDVKEACSFLLEGEMLLNLADPSKTQPILTLQNKKIHVLAGIGNPERFFNALKQFGLDIIPHSYPDHYQFRAEDFHHFSDEDIVLMTEKDAVKCFLFAKKNYWFLPVKASFNALLVNALKQKMTKLRTMA